MTTKRETVPPMAKLRPSDVLTTPAESKPPPKNIKATYYLPQDLVDLVDDMRIAARDNGVRVDKSQVVRACLELCLRDHALPVIDKLREAS